MTKKTVKTIPEEELNQLSKEQLVEIIKAFQEEMAQFKQILKIDSKTSSKPPSADIHKKSENKKYRPKRNRIIPKENRVDNSHLAPGNLDVKTTTTCKRNHVCNMK